MTDTIKIKTKLGGDEFEMEGPAEIVNARYEQFLSRAGSPRSPVPPPAAAATAPAAPAADTPPLDVVKPPAPDGITEELLTRAFSVEKDIVTLRVLPKGDAVASNVMLLLLYGYKRIKGQEGIVGSRLAKAAKKTGVEILRMDRALGPYENLVLAAGVGRGRGYSLNNPGILKAEEILKGIFQ